MEEDEADFVQTTLTEACEACGFHLAEIDAAGMCKFTKETGATLLVHVSSLGSLLAVTASSQPSNAIRTLRLTPEQAHSVEFVQTHLVSWLENGGTYEAQARPHLQGLSPDLVARVSNFLDGASAKNLRNTNKTLHGVIPPSTARDSAAPRPSHRTDHTWYFYDLAYI